MKLTINEEYKNLIPPLSAEEYRQLELNIRADGCRDPLVVWGGTIIDGHNRYDICTEHGIDFNVEQVEFETSEEAKDWIDANQLGRRNLSPDQRRIVIGRRYNREKKNKEDNLKQNAPKDKNCTSATADKLASEYKTHPNTVKNYAKDAKFYERLKKEEPQAARDIWSGKKTLKAVKYEQKKKERAEQYTEREMPKGRYRVIYADPPWKYNDKCIGGGAQPGGGVEVRHYDTMSIAELCEMPLPEVDDDAVLFLWTTSPLLEDSFKIIKAWGFKYKTSFVWDKIKHNMGHYNSVRHEFLLICTRGSCTPDNIKLFDSVQSIAKTAEHSRKPEEFRDIIDTLYTWGNKIELFRRGDAPNGWKVWGNEAQI